ncbi:MAG: biopolymer transporter ExbD [Burkholderiales bacterium PBB4]|nr:MAG: biopolymer transporter ExbD [Burkholderiales bacterium PBB4]
MAFGMHDTTADSDGDMMNEINMTPLVDVMLVLLIIFIITVPVMKHALHIELPRANTQPQTAKPAVPLLRAEADKAPQPELHIRGDKAARYEFVMAAMAQARQVGLKKIAFISDPGAKPL